MLRRLLRVFSQSPSPTRLLPFTYIRANEAIADRLMRTAARTINKAKQSSPTFAGKRLPIRPLDQAPSLRVAQHSR